MATAKTRMVIACCGLLLWSAVSAHAGLNPNGLNPNGLTQNGLTQNGLSLNGLTKMAGLMA